MNRMRFCDLFCGVGGFSQGACDVATPVLGVDNDHTTLRHWSANTKANGLVRTLFEEQNDIPWPMAARDLHVHMSPPCTTLSRASGQKACNVGLELLEQSVRWVLRKRYTSWSLETVSTPKVRAFFQRIMDETAVAEGDGDEVALDMDWVVIDAQDYGVPSTRTRIIAGNARTIRQLRQRAVRRVTVADAMAAAHLPLPAPCLKNGTRTREKRPCVRSAHGMAHTQTASHPLTWCDADGVTVRCLTVRETAVLMGFREDWLLPSSYVNAIRALGNAVPPPLARAIMESAIAAVDEDTQ